MLTLTVTLTFDLLISQSMHTEQLLLIMCLPTLVLIAQDIFLLEQEQINKHTIHKVTNMTVDMGRGTIL